MVTPRYPRQLRGINLAEEKRVCECGDVKNKTQRILYCFRMKNRFNVGETTKNIYIFFAKKKDKKCLIFSVAKGETLRCWYSQRLRRVPDFAASVLKENLLPGAQRTATARRSQSRNAGDLLHQYISRSGSSTGQQAGGNDHFPKNTFVDACFPTTLLQQYPYISQSSQNTRQPPTTNYHLLVIFTYLSNPP